MTKRKAFTVEEVRAIRACDTPAAELAAHYGVRIDTIYNIRAWRTWKKLDRHLKPTRRPKINASGEVHCSRCRKYLPASQFRPHSGRLGRLWAYCRTCERLREYQRPRNQPGTPEWRQAIAWRTERKRRQRSGEALERRRFVASGIDLLRRRGFTKTEICKLCGITFTNLLIWERQAAQPTPNAGHRIAIVLRETAHLRAGSERAYRRIRPHPELPLLMARIEPQLARYPLRNSWKNGRRRRASEEALAA